MQTQDAHYYVYIFGDKPREDVEIGIAGNLQQHVLQHKSPQTSQVAPLQKAKLVYYEHYAASEEAQTREQQIKGGGMDSAYNLIESMNPNWLDLSDTLED
ncbi:GIY-YIG nuclease family protein [Pontibacter akesuensis]|uniref:Putative endonuclease n=1 Tax=Pontibacter akesuensis TaxID=388950 RepID=A0A1I7FZN7_9BACT|nr:GIY-YIG nuclease family protein [Pontibacter akesuensis]GHA59748.1 nuclease [Pontibacter akesuensis]SFU41531.1 putative endonuclease [Pontibacter akesuensis]